MSHLFGCVLADAEGNARPALMAMSAVLRCDPRQQLSMFTCEGFGLGVLESPSLDSEGDDLRPGRTADGRYALWMAGEAFASGDTRLPLRDCAESRTLVFRQRLLERRLAAGSRPIELLDGEYQIAIWDAVDRSLTLFNDRFGGLPWYWAESPAAIGFAGGVRGALLVPGVDATPDREALKEAVTFGGYRLGARTNVIGVHMLAGGSEVSVRHGHLRIRRYWSWKDIQPRAAGSPAEQIDELQSLWRASVARRLAGPGRFGQTLSGGLDSRAILAEAAPGRDWTAITYGVPGCDDARYARRAAAAVQAHWMFQELYGGESPDWLERRTGFIQQTDGLIQLGDLMHLESLDAQRAAFDVHISGYLGDAVSGPTFAAIAGSADALHKLPWYSTAIGLEYSVAYERVAALAADLDGAPPRFVLFAHKAPQSTNRWTAAWRPWLRVRKPFLDYAFFDFCQGLPVDVRIAGRLHERWLRRTYPACFAAIPNQRTGVPALAPRWSVEFARAARRGRTVLRRGVPARWRPPPRARAYHDDDRVWRSPAAVGRIVDTILRRDSLCCDVLGRARVEEVIRPWIASAAAPAQVIGALYVYETYHRDLARTLADARRLAPDHNAVCTGRES